MIVVLIILLAAAFAVGWWYKKNTNVPGFDDWDKGDWHEYEGPFHD